MQSLYFNVGAALIFLIDMKLLTFVYFTALNTFHNRKCIYGKKNYAENFWSVAHCKGLFTLAVGEGDSKNLRLSSVFMPPPPRLL